MEATLYETLRTLGYQVTPVGPDSDDQALTGQVEGPIILYRRKGCEPERDLAGSVIFETIQVEILVSGDTCQQAQAIALEVRTLLDNEEFDGFNFWINNQFANEDNLTVVHQWWTVTNE